MVSNSSNSAIANQSVLKISVFNSLEKSFTAKQISERKPYEMGIARPTLSQFWSFKIRRTTFLNYIKLVGGRWEVYFYKALVLRKTNSGCQPVWIIVKLALPDWIFLIFTFPIRQLTIFILFRSDDQGFWATKKY